MCILVQTNSFYYRVFFKYRGMWKSSGSAVAAKKSHQLRWLSLFLPLPEGATATELFVKSKQRLYKFP